MEKFTDGFTAFPTARIQAPAKKAEKLSPKKSCELAICFGKGRMAVRLKVAGPIIKSVEVHKPRIII